LGPKVSRERGSASGVWKKKKKGHTKGAEAPTITEAGYRVTTSPTKGTLSAEKVGEYLGGKIQLADLANRNSSAKRDARGKYLEGEP